MKNLVVKIGVLDIQGSVEEHLEALRKLSRNVLKKTNKSMEPVLVKNVEQLRHVNGLIIPGGESTTIGKLLRRFGLRDEIIRLARNGKLAVWGTCAGAILMAKKIVGKQRADSLGLMDIVIERNAYGRQLDSFETEIKFDFCQIPAVFIRAPKIVSAGKGVKILAKYKREIVAARQKKFLVTNFHPELTDSPEVHRYFAKMC